MLRPAAVGIAYGVENAFSSKGGNELLNIKCQQDCADGREEKVVDEEQRLQLEGLSVAH